MGTADDYWEAEGLRHAEALRTLFALVASARRRGIPLDSLEDEHLKHTGRCIDYTRFKLDDVGEFVEQHPQLVMLTKTTAVDLGLMADDGGCDGDKQIVFANKFVQAAAAKHLPPDFWKGQENLKRIFECPSGSVTDTGGISRARADNETVRASNKALMSAADTPPTAEELAQRGLKVDKVQYIDPLDGRLTQAQLDGHKRRAAMFCRSGGSSRASSANVSVDDAAGFGDVSRASHSAASSSAVPGKPVRLRHKRVKAESLGAYTCQTKEILAKLKHAIYLSGQIDLGQAMIVETMQLESQRMQSQLWDELSVQRVMIERMQLSLQAKGVDLTVDVNNIFMLSSTEPQDPMSFFYRTDFLAFGIRWKCILCALIWHKGETLGMPALKEEAIRFNISYMEYNPLAPSVMAKCWAEWRNEQWKLYFDDTDDNQAVSWYDKTIYDDTARMRGTPAYRSMVAVLHMCVKGNKGFAMYLKLTGTRQIANAARSHCFLSIGYNKTAWDGVTKLQLELFL